MVGSTLSFVRVVSVNVAEEATIELKGKAVRTGIFKTPRAGPQALRRDGFEGDTIVESRRGAAGDQAVSAYAREHYEAFADALEDDTPGAFGENLTTEGLLETGARIGDVLGIGDAVLQISHPRLPCRKLDHRHGRGFSRRFLASRRVGFYLRVLEPGAVRAGDAIRVLDRDERSPTIDDFVRVTQHEYWDSEGLACAHLARDLAPEWREVVAQKLDRSRAADGWFGERALRVTAIEPVAGDVARVRLECARGQPLPAFVPGQLLPISVPSPDGGRSYHRRLFTLVDGSDGGASYAIAGRARAPHRLLHGGRACSFLPPELEPGDELRAVAPVGEFALPHGDGTLLFVTEGLGSAPVLPMLRQLEARASAGPIYLAHCDVRPEAHAFAGETRAVCERLGVGARAYYRTPAGALPDDAAVRAGWPVTAELVEWAAGPAPLRVLLAGSESYLTGVAASLKELGVAPEHVRRLAFGAGDE